MAAIYGLFTAISLGLSYKYPFEWQGYLLLFIGMCFLVMTIIEGLLL